MPTPARHADIAAATVTVEATSEPPVVADVGRNRSDDFESRIPPIDPMMGSSPAPAIHGGA